MYKRQAPLGCPPPKKFFPNFSKILGEGTSFSSALNGDSQGPSGIKFRQLYLGPLPRKKIPKFRSYSTISRVTRKFHQPRHSEMRALIPPKSGPKYTPGVWSARKLGTNNRISIWPPCTKPPMREVYYVWATTLNFGPDVQLHEWTYWPKYRPPRPIATGTKRPEKNLENRFSHKMAAKTTSGSGFRPHSCSLLTTWSFQAKISKIFQGHFFEIFGVKLENFKNYLNELQEFPIQKFLIFCSRCGPL